MAGRKAHSGEVRVTWSRVTGRLAATLVALLAWAAAALAADGKAPDAAAKSAPLKVMVARLSNQGRGVDPRASELESKLRSQGFSYDSVEVLQETSLPLA